MTTINLVTAKTILTKSGLPGADYVINPYNGCLFGCMYCYAAQIARWKHPDETWGSYLDVKINAPDLLKEELEGISGTIFFSSVTDPYVGPESKYQLTRKCLEVLANAKYKDTVSILTKSPLVTRDIDVLKRLKTEVGCTITSLNDNVSRFLEVNAPPVTARIAALKKLHEAGIKTYAFVGPITPVIANKQSIVEIIDALEDAGVSEVWFEHINLSSKIKARLFEFLEKESPELISNFEETETKKYREKLNAIIYKAMKGRKIKMAFDTVIYHKELPKKK